MMRFIETLNGIRHDPPPIWIMRQAGRYLPEYREVRQTTPDFISFCLNSDKATEVTLQPIKRYNFDASIIFSDILLIPWAMNRNVHFIPGKGPVLDKLDTVKDIEIFAQTDLSDKYKAVGEAVQKTRLNLPETAALIGFSGAPWTLMTYLFEGGSSRDFAATKSYLWSNPDAAVACIDILVEKVIEFLTLQADNGANALMLFDSWASAVPASWRDKLIINPHEKIIQQLRKRGINLPVICFPKGLGEGLIAYSEQVDASCIALDQHTDPIWAHKTLRADLPLQGNLDPLCLVAGGQQLKDEVNRLLDCFADRPHIFNLGHGVVPQTPPEHVQQLVELVRKKR